MATNGHNSQNWLAVAPVGVTCLMDCISVLLLPVIIVAMRTVQCLHQHRRGHGSATTPNKQIFPCQALFSTTLHLHSLQ
jgi:hypothetical protein